MMVCFCLQIFLGAALLLLVSSAWAQAPGDEHERCTAADPGSDTIVTLMNSHHYTDLLGEDGVWDQISFDDNNSPESRISPPFVSPSFFTCRTEVDCVPNTKTIEKRNQQK